MLELGCTKIRQSPYTPDIAPSDCHLLRSMDQFIYGRRFAEVDEVTTVVYDICRSKPTELHRDVNQSVHEKRRNLI
ncbi:unnamed protein product [Heligmosomoides polygyrus]|uniref:Histone acetyltransferase n=1 Tax=Heligmosomoides polygyrus TaxID=6339 RepID=A0A183FRT3_HELPZ|nr:unnamed protein product [Heligmosomoides polygyrus]